MPLLGALMGFSLLLGTASFPIGMNAVSQTGTTTVAVPPIPSYPVTLTGYNAVVGQTDDDPSETASGAFSNPEVVMARSQDLAEELPFGTIVSIEGSASSSPDGWCGYSTVASSIGYRVIADTMNIKFKNRVDVLFDTKTKYKTADRGFVNAARVLGLCKGMTARVVGFVDINHIPKTQAELKTIVKEQQTTLAVGMTK